ncbi:MAG TPA: hypothetical protein VEF05_05235 [Terriglobales bacterium]|nr:hypothetical protein [Terriglobales bacterium]
MGRHRWVGNVGTLLLASAALAQADQPLPSQPSQTPVQPSPVQQTPKYVPGKPPESIADAARASREASESAPPIKIYRNKDVRDPAEELRGPASASRPTPPSAPPAKTADEMFMDKEHQFEAQGTAYKNQILAQEAKIVSIENHIDQLESQFADWTTWYTDDGDVSLCWTDLGNTYYYKPYCDVGKGLRTQAETAQRQLAQEKARLADMQEYIRRQGYGNAVYEPDE